jgi:hypothetical protein
MGWQQTEQMLKQGDGILLLLSWRVDVGKEKGNIVTTDKGHLTAIIKLLHVGF